MIDRMLLTAGREVVVVVGLLLSSLHLFEKLSAGTASRSECQHHYTHQPVWMETQVSLNHLLPTHHLHS